MQLSRSSATALKRRLQKYSTAREASVAGGGASVPAALLTKKVVIIGAGYTGTAAARALDPHFDVTVVSRQECMVHNIGGLRASVIPGFQPRVVVPLGKLLTRGRLVKGVEATSVDTDSKRVLLSNGEELPYDYVVVAMGSLGPKTMGAAIMPTTAEAISAMFKQRQETIRAAQRILIVGGGPIGIELAGEIASQYGPNKSISLVTSRGLMEDPHAPFSSTFKAALKKQLENLRVAVHLNAGHMSMGVTDDTGLVVGKALYKWEGGEKEFDLAIPCLGTRMLPPLIAASGWRDKLDGVYLKVDELLQVEGTSPGTVFAIGDINDVHETKLSYTGGMQAQLVARNIIAAAMGQPLTPYKAHTKGSALVPIGPKWGAGELGGMQMGSFMCSAIKGKDLFVSKTWAGVGAKAELAALK